MLGLEDVLTPKKIKKFLFDVCPVNSLVTLNSLYRASRVDHLEEGASRSSEEAEGLISAEEQRQRDIGAFLSTVKDSCLHQVLLPSRRLPAEVKKQVRNFAQCYIQMITIRECEYFLIPRSSDLKLNIFQIFRDIGFSESESSQLLFSAVRGLSDKTDGVLVSDRQYVTVMAKRLRMLRKNRQALLVADPNALVYHMTHWDALLEKVALNGGKSNKDAFLLERRTGSLAIESEKDFSNAKAIHTLVKFFGADDSLVKLRLDLRASPYSKMGLPAWRVPKALALLTDRGFTKAQIRRALPLLHYPVSAIDQHIGKVSEELGVGEEEEIFLLTVLYHIERAANFSGTDAFWMYPEEAPSEESLRFTDDLVQEAIKAHPPRATSAEKEERAEGPTASGDIFSSRNYDVDHTEWDDGGGDHDSSSHIPSTS